MNEKPKILGTRLIYDGWSKLREDQLEIKGVNGAYPYAVTTIGDGVGVLPFINSARVLLSRQYRHPVDDFCLELIQGGISMGETPKQAAERELLEETGYTGNLKHLIDFYPLPGSLEMTMGLFYATEMKHVCQPTPNPLETMDLIEKPYMELLSEVLTGKHKDSALINAVLLFELRTKHSI